MMAQGFPIYNLDSDLETKALNYVKKYLTIIICTYNSFFKSVPKEMISAVRVLPAEISCFSTILKKALYI